jgi:hypothetical protein
MSLVEIKMLRSYSCPGKGELGKGKHLVTHAQAEFLVNRKVAKYTKPRPTPVIAPVKAPAPEPVVVAEPEPIAGPLVPVDLTDEDTASTENYPARKRGHKGSRKYSSETPD